MTLTLLPLGTGDAFSATHHSCSNLLLCDGSALLVDCPHPIRKVMRDAQQRSRVMIDLPDVDACVITHLHADHASGVEGYLWFNRFALGRRGRLLMHPRVRERIWDAHLAAGMDQLMRDDGTFEGLAFEDVCEPLLLDAQAPVTIGPFAIEARQTVHHIPTFALRVSAGGRSVAFSADTAWDDALFAWLAQADLIVHEAGHGPAHTPLERLLELPAPVRARVRLTHLSDGVDRDALPIACLREGEPIAVGSAQSSGGSTENV